MLLKNKKCSNCGAYYDPTLNECPSCHKTNELREQRHVPDSIAFFHPIAQIGIFLAGFAFVGMVIYEIIAVLILKSVSDKNLASALLPLLTYIMMLGALLTIVFTTRRKAFIDKFKRPFDYLFGLAYAGAIVITGLIIGLIVSQFYKESNVNQETVVSLVKNYPILAGILICVLGPICEELTYRVGLYSFLRRINMYLAMAVTTIVFALIHFDFGAENIAGELWSLPSYLVCGLLLSIAYEHRGPACSISAHMFYNAASMVAIFIRLKYGQ